MSMRCRLAGVAKQVAPQHVLEFPTRRVTSMEQCWINKLLAKADAGCRSVV